MTVTANIKGQYADLEDECLRLCLAAIWESDSLDQAQLVCSNPTFDWITFLDRIDREKLAPLVYTVVRNQSWVPESVSKQLHHGYMQSGSRNALLMQSLVEILGWLKSADIEVIVLKGAALIETIYGSIATRPMADLDLLLHPHDVPRAQELLGDQGYHEERLEPRSGAVQEYENEILLWKRSAMPVPLELHWDLLDSPYYQDQLPTSWFWQAAIPTEISGMATFVLGPEAQLLHLCAHQILHHSHDEQRLWLVDVAGLIHTYQDQMDWEVILAKAQAFDLVMSVQAVMRQVLEIWPHLPVDSEIVTGLFRLTPSKAETRAVGWLFARHRSLDMRFWADLATMPGYGRKSRFVLVNLFPSPAYMRQRYAIKNQAMLPLYYAYRLYTGALSTVSALRRRME